MYHIQWIVIVLLSFVFVSTDIVVKTTTGKVRGTTVELPDGNQVEAFLGVPFAEPPVGKLRFEKPVPVRHWEGEYNATSLPPPCYQNYTIKFYWTPDVERMTEDCLYLNIWVPGSVQETKPKAVFVWIHGVGFNVGSSEMDVYNGAFLASRGNIIVTSFNFRLGMFGFLTTSIPEASGNMGIYDQILAFKWIKANVKFFGGNSELITLAGQGVGAVSAALLLLSPMTRGMAKRVVLESGGVINPISTHLNETMLEVSEQVSKNTGCSNSSVSLTTNPKMVVSCLKNLPPSAISQAEGLDTLQFPITAAPFPGDDFLPRNPTDMLIDGDFQDIEVLLGCNKDEASSFIVYAERNFFGVYGDKAPTIEKRYAGYLIKRMFERTELKHNTRSITRFYMDGNGKRRIRNKVNDDDEIDYIKTAMYDSAGDYLIVCPTVFQADFMSVREKPVYFYLFTHRPSTTLNAKWMGVTHFDEVPFVFGRPLSDDKNYTGEDKMISRRMMDRWIAFIKTGNPNIEGEIEWPHYKWNEPLYLDIDVEEKVKRKPDDYRCEFWRAHFRSTLDHFRSGTNGGTSIGTTGPLPVSTKKVPFVLLMMCVMLLTMART